MFEQSIADGVQARQAGAAVVMISCSATAGLSATLSTATINTLANGGHTVSVRSQDALGNWGSLASITLNVDVGSGDTAGPLTSGVSASPNPNNGTIPFNISVLAVRVTASFSDALSGGSNLTNAEGFLDAPGATGTGFVFIACDGNFNSPSENGYSDIPLAVVNALSNGNHPICVHAKDAAGNWGAFDCTTPLTLDKTAPVINGATLTQNTIALGTATVTLNVTASDGTGTGITGGTYAIDAGATVVFNGVSAVIPTSTLPAGAHTVHVRLSDAVGNVSTYLL